MAISHNHVQAMRHRIQESLGSPKKRRKKKRVHKAMREQLTLADFLVSML